MNEIEKRVKLEDVEKNGKDNKDIYDLSLQMVFINGELGSAVW